MIRFRTSAETNDSDIRRSSQSTRSRVARISKRAGHSLESYFRAGQGDERPQLCDGLGGVPGLAGDLGQPDGGFSELEHGAMVSVGLVGDAEDVGRQPQRDRDAPQGGDVVDTTFPISSAEMYVLAGVTSLRRFTIWPDTEDQLS